MIITSVLHYNKKLYLQLISKYGSEPQVNQCIQELAETIVAFTKIAQHGYNEQTKSNLFQEVTQSFVMLFQIVELYEIPIQDLLEREELELYRRFIEPDLYKKGFVFTESNNRCYVTLNSYATQEDIKKLESLGFIIINPTVLLKT